MTASRLEIAAIAQSLRSRLDATHRTREQALRLCRETIQHAARAIRCVHRHETDPALACLAECRTRVLAVRDMLNPYPDLYWAGYVSDAQKEYTEAAIVFALVEGSPLPGPEELSVEPPAYLNGAAEAASECRRYVLDCLRSGSNDRAAVLLAAMDDIYFELVTFDYPDSVTGGLRRTTDALRAVLERTRSDVTLTEAQHRLEAAIRAMTGPPAAAWQPDSAEK